ncbi:MAG TPA: hypothetical protein VM940_15720 [Chthoniobacterales bacterium]|nr:hypothetical protein [Chthoniobacterales bacterium]
MKTTRPAQALSDSMIDSHRLITGLRHALDVSYGRVLAAAKHRWEQDFEATDPANACVTVRISSGKPTAGVLKKPSFSLMHGARRVSPA